MFRAVTLNLNGLRSAAAKGFEAWVDRAGLDCMGVQEVRAQAGQVLGRHCRVAGMQGHFHFAERKGYAGVGVYVRHEPSDVRIGFGAPEFDVEGRFIETRFDTPRRKLSLISAYFPSGSSGEHRQQAKFRFLSALYPHLLRLHAEREFILMTDANIAHHEIDLKNWRGNRRNSGFLPEERAWMTRLLDELGLVDVHRALRPHDTGEAYTWWSNRGQARANNVGWRIDYQLATPGLAALARRAGVFREQRFSDHAPLSIDYDFRL